MHLNSTANDSICRAVNKSDEPTTPILRTFDKRLSTQPIDEYIVKMSHIVLSFAYL